MVLLTYALILITWSLVAAALTGMGVGAARLWLGTKSPRTLANVGPWLGLAIGFLIAILGSLVGPLRSTLGVSLLVMMAALGLALIGHFLYANGAHAWAHFRRTLSIRRVPTFAVLFLLGVAEIVLVRFAAGDPMDGDTGGYRMGAINYASDYGTVPGLANLHSRFGFNTSLSPLGALLNNGLWSGQGFRLVAGLCTTVLIIGIGARLLIPRRTGPSIGDWFLLIAGSYVFAMILTDSGRWIPSPSTDLVVLILTVGALAFLLDFVQSVDARASGSLALILLATAGSVRPLAWVSFATVFVVVCVLTGRRQRWGVGGVCRSLLAPTVFAGLILFGMLARDYLLTGWLLYPSTLLGFDVPWKSAPGTEDAEWITSWARARDKPKDEVLANFDWFRPWLDAFIRSREVYLNAVLAVVAVLPVLWPSGRRAWRAALSILAWAYPPVLVTFVVWFVTAPDVRFGWPALAALAAMPLSAVFALGGYPAMLLRIGGTVMLILLVLSNIANGRLTPRGADLVPTELRLGPFSMSVPLGPTRSEPLADVTMADGNRAVHATGGNCWYVYPLCGNTAEELETAYFLGDSVSDGFGTTRRVP